MTVTYVPSPGEKAVLFDLGGTLASYGPVVSIAARSLGLPAEGATYERIAHAIGSHRERYDAGGTDEAYWQAVSDEAGGPQLDHHAVSALVAADAARWGRLAPSVMRLVTSLRDAHVRMGVLSNAPRSLARTFDNQPWSAAFAVQRFSCFTKIPKPEPAAFELAVRALGFAPGDVVYFDDRQANVDAAKVIGMDAHLWSGAADARTILADRGILQADAAQHAGAS